LRLASPIDWKERMPLHIPVLSNSSSIASYLLVGNVGFDTVEIHVKTYDATPMKACYSEQEMIGKKHCSHGTLLADLLGMKQLQARLCLQHGRL
jgi:hypothetical protein